MQKRRVLSTHLFTWLQEALDQKQRLDQYQSVLTKGFEPHISVLQALEQAGYQVTGYSQEIARKNLLTDDEITLLMAKVDDLYNFDQLLRLLKTTLQNLGKGKPPAESAATAAFQNSQDQQDREANPAPSTSSNSTSSNPSTKPKQTCDFCKENKPNWNNIHKTESCPVLKYTYLRKKGI